MGAGKAQRRLGHGVLLRRVGQQGLRRGHPLPHGADPLRRPGRQRQLGCLGKIEGMRPHQHRAAAGCGLDQVLPTKRLKAAAQQRHIGQPVIKRHLTQGITEPDRRRLPGSTSSRTGLIRLSGRPWTALAAPDQRKTPGLHQRSHCVKALRVARHDQPLQLICY